MKECDILRVKTYSDPPTYLQGVKPPPHPTTVRACTDMSQQVALYTAERRKN